MTLHLSSSPGRPHRRRPSSRLLAAFPLILAMLLGVVFGAAAPAAALTATGVGYGHRSAVDGRWLGSWAFDDGTVGFCINLDLPIPPGHSYEHVDGETLGWFTPEDAARLAYLSRNWGATQNADDAAAGQLATWMITGLNGQTPQSIAARAGAAAGHVLARANEMLAAADGPGGASRGASASVHLDQGDDGYDLVRTELAVDSVASGITTLPPGTHTGTVTLDGASFADGALVKELGNGEAHRIVPSADNAVVSFSASVSFADLPYGSGLTIARSQDHVQSVLIARPISVAAAAEADRTRPTPMPFQPVVVTTTSHPTAAPGAEIVDQLSVGIATGTGLSSEWGVVGPDGGPYTPIVAIVRSQLLGPFSDRPVESPEAPIGAPVVCEVTTTIDRGPGDYTTPSCVLPDSGYYVWVERIEPGDTAPEAGGGMILPWRSAFGVASETTFSAAPETPSIPEPRLAETGTDESAMVALAIGSASALALGALMLALRGRALATARQESGVTPLRAAGRAERGRRRATARPGSR